MPDGEGLSRKQSKGQSTIFGKALLVEGAVYAKALGICGTAR